MFGWLVSLVIVVTLTILATGNNPPQPNTAPSLASLAVKIALGVVLVVIAVRHIRARSKPKPPKKPPKWQEHVDSMSPWFALVLAPTLQPWVLIGAGVATVAEAKLSSWESPGPDPRGHRRGTRKPVPGRRPARTHARHRRRYPAAGSGFPRRLRRAGTT